MLGLPPFARLPPGNRARLLVRALVRIQVGILWQQCVSRVCRMSTAVFETARRGSIPRRDFEIDTSLGGAGFAYDPAKVEDQVQFLARTLESVLRKRVLL